MEQSEERVFRRVLSTSIAFNLRKHHEVALALSQEEITSQLLPLSLVMFEQKRVSAGLCALDTAHTPAHLVQYKKLSYLLN